MATLAEDLESLKRACADCRDEFIASVIDTIKPGRLVTVPAGWSLCFDAGPFRSATPPRPQLKPECPWLARLNPSQRIRFPE